MKDPATELEPGQAARLQIGIGSVTKEPPRGSGQRGLQVPESGKSPGMNGQDWSWGYNSSPLGSSNVALAGQ